MTAGPIATNYPERMRGWTCTGYGPPDVLKLADLPVPRPKAGEVLLRVLATTVSSADARMRALRFPAGFSLMGRLALGWNRPRRPVFGSEAVAEVAALGEGVTEFALQDRVIAFPDLRLGAHAEYLTMVADGLLVPLPDGMALPEAAAMCFGGMTARSFLGRAGARAGERILVLGAAGTVGSAMVQLAKHAGLSVTAVTSREKVERVAGLGGDQVIDRRQIDFRSLGQTWDIVADTVAASSFADARAVLREGGRYLAIAGSLGELLALPRQGRRTIGWPGSLTRADLIGLTELVRTGAFRPLIDRVLPFDELPAAHAIVDGGGKSGSIVIRVGAD